MLIQFLISRTPNSLWSCSKVPKIFLFWWKGLSRPWAGNGTHTGVLTVLSTALWGHQPSPKLLGLVFAVAWHVTCGKLWLVSLLLAVPSFCGCCQGQHRHGKGGVNHNEPFSGGKASNASTGRRKRGSVWQHGCCWWLCWLSCQR